MKRARVFSVAAIALAGFSSAAADPRLFLIDGYNAQLNFSCDILGMMPVEGGFTRFLAVVAIDEEAPGEARAVVRVDAKSMSLSDSDWAEKLRGPDFFNVARYPEFSFTSSSAHLVEPGLVRIDGQLSLRGIRQPFSLNVRYHVTPDGKHDTATIEATGELDRTQFGMTAYDLLVSDDVSISVDGTMMQGFRPIIPGGG